MCRRTMVMAIFVRFFFLELAVQYKFCRSMYLCVCAWVFNFFCSHCNIYFYRIHERCVRVLCTMHATLEPNYNGKMRFHYLCTFYFMNYSNNNQCCSLFCYLLSLEIISRLCPFFCCCCYYFSNICTRQFLMICVCVCVLLSRSAQSLLADLTQNYESWFEILSDD